MISELKSLFKAGVLVANVLPVLTGFLLALHFNHLSFVEHWDLLVLTLLGSTCIMAGALAINNWYDVDIDTVMERTKRRPTVTGTLSLRTVLLLGVSLSVVGTVLLLFTSIEATIYALIGWITYVFLYTMWSKRRYTFNTLIGSVSGAVTPLIGWAAIESANHIVPIVLFLILFIFQMPHTYVIAIRKYEEYKAAGVAMLPVVKGFQVTKRQTVLYIALLVPIPFLLMSLGTLFVILATFVSGGWLILAISGFYTKDDLTWAYRMFKYSVYYLMIIFMLMIVVTI
ncbi:protoheme IX farnesyltransferase [Ornithinibacillus sp. L9]|uniref:Protoheme IX farnesyltransferase n=2 Tax=Ornithinibacillus caprae TaxID=2678566 RepID=A0A6N8FL52_9BACI|nr:heme o synthase [Ornithinibacillus caprae]MUK90195.1 protoheme IX farnesyltransferase [Ornithinibacillus caprae]